MKSREPKCSMVVRTVCSSEWSIQTLVGVVTHYVCLPGAPNIEV
jgi:hypothetical protein